MTLKEEATKLVDSFLEWIEAADKFHYELESMKLYIAKQCAIKSVEHTIEVLDKVGDNEDDGGKYSIVYNACEKEMNHQRELIKAINKL